MAVSTNCSATEQVEITTKYSHQVEITKQDDTEAIEDGELVASGVLNVVVSGLGLFSDGYNAQISECTFGRNLLFSACLRSITNLSIRDEVGYMEPLFSVLFVPTKIPLFRTL